jgi:hypothetical protein
MQADILDGCPDDSQATHLGSEHVNLIGALPHEASQTLDGIGSLNVAVHALRELVKGEGLLFLLSQASHRFWIALAVFGECSPPAGSMPPVLSVGPRCQRVRPGPRLARVEGWQRAHCVAYATCQR